MRIKQLRTGYAFIFFANGSDGGSGEGFPGQGSIAERGVLRGLSDKVGVLVPGE